MKVSDHHIVGIFAVVTECGRCMYFRNTINQSHSILLGTKSKNLKYIQNALKVVFKF